MATIVAGLRQAISNGVAGEALGRVACTLVGARVALDLSGQGLGDLPEPLARALLAPPLRSLDLSANEMGCAGVQALATALAGQSSLTSLDLSGNSLGCKGLVALAPAVAASTALRHLDLSDNNVAVHGAVHVGHFLRYVEGRGALACAVLPGLWGTLRPVSRRMPQMVPTDGC